MGTTHLGPSKETGEIEIYIYIEREGERESAREGEKRGEKEGGREEKEEEKSRRRSFAKTEKKLFRLFSWILGAK